MAAQVQSAAAMAQVSGGDGDAAAASFAAFAAACLYVGDLDVSVHDDQLWNFFSQVGMVLSVHLCRDADTRRSLGYAYVLYLNRADAARALEVLNFKPINEKPIRITYSKCTNLDTAIDNKALYDTFSVFGDILTCKVATNASGESKGYGFVLFVQDEAAQSATNKLNGMLLNDKKVYVGPPIRKQVREDISGSAKFNNVYIKNLSESTTKHDLREIFREFGPITSAIVMREGDGKSKCFGFVNFENPDDAAEAVEELNGKKFDDKEWYVGKAQKKSERERELKERFERTLQGAAGNLYLKNLDDSIGDEKLRELFAEYGTITSSKVICDSNGVSKGFGFVAFKSPEDASRALTEMNGKMFGSKPLYVALAERKEDREARLQAQFSQMHPGEMPPSASSNPQAENVLGLANAASE